MDCQVCSEEIPDDSLFCPECGARQDPSKSGRNFGVVSSQAIQATHDMQATDAAGGSAAGAVPSDFLNQIAGQMTGDQGQQPTSPDQSTSITDQVVDQIVESERAEKAGARNEWLNMNQKTASGVLAGLAGGEVPEHLASSTGAARFLDDGQDVGMEKKRAKSNQPSPSLLRRMAEVASRRVARKRGVAVESPQVAMTEDDTVQVNVTYIDDGRVLDTPPDLSNAFEHAISTELALKGFDIGIEIALFRSLDGTIELVWGDASATDDGAVDDDDDDDLFACDDCGHYPIRESDSSCPSCGAQFIDDDLDDQPAPSRGSGGPPSRGSGGPPTRGPGGGPGGPPSGPSRSPSGGPPRGPSRGSGGGPPSKGPGGGPPSRGPGGGPPSKGPGGGPPSRGPGGGPPSKGPGGGPPSKGPGGPPKRKGPPR